MKTLEIKGYSSCKLFSSGIFCDLYAAIQIKDGCAVVLKMPKSSPPTRDEIASLEHEWEIMQGLGEASVLPKIYAKELIDGVPVIVMEKSPYPSLKEWLDEKKRFSVELFLPFALAAAEAIGQVHRHNIIHKDISPANLLYDEKNKACKLIDFGLSIAINHQKIIPVDPRFLEGTLPYISPEQSGRMNRGIDYRTDYYSLGIVFYQMLTGRLPFFSEDPLEMVHLHMAMQPPSPTSLDPSIPQILSQILLKLLAKEPEERYQSIAGIQGDLFACLMGLREGKIAPFPLAAKDTHERFEIPQKIYGREKEINTLLTLYKKILEGESGFMLIGGYSGIGKTALVREVYKLIAKSQVEIISGKFEQLKKNIPYFALAQALQEYILNILSFPEEEFVSIRKKMSETLGMNGQLMIDLLPSLEKVIGKQPPLQQLGFVEAQNRFNNTFQNFINCLPSAQKPLILFLDDLQWADLPSLKIVEMLVKDMPPYFMIVGGYRDNEVDQGHPLALMQGVLQKKEIPFELISLKPLTLSDLQALIADALYKQKNEVLPLAELCYKKSGGNPFFLIQLLENFAKKNWIFYDWDEANWHWDLKQIADAPFSDNIAEFMQATLSSLHPKVQRCLSIASCIGSHFSIDLLEVLWPEEKQHLRQYLTELLQKEFITSSKERYYDAKIFSFSHDRIQEGAHNLLLKVNQIELHLSLARILEKTAPDKKSDDLLFKIVDHANWVLDHQPTFECMEQREKKHFASLNLAAAKNAKASSAHEVAIDYCKKSLQWLQGGNWQNDYSLLVELYIAAMESAYLAQQYEEMEGYGAVVMANSHDPLDRNKVLMILVMREISTLNNTKVIDILLEGLRELGLPLTKKVSGLKLLRECGIVGTKFLMQGHTIEKLATLPEMTDPPSKAILHMINFCISGIINSGNVNLTLLLILKQMQLILSKGNSKESASIFSLIGFLLLSFGISNYCFKFHNAAVVLLNRYPDPNVRAVAMFYIYLAAFCRQRIATLQPLFLQEYHLALEAGNLEYASYHLANFHVIQFFTSPSLVPLTQEFETYQKPLEKLRNKHALIHVQLYHNAILELTGQTEKRAQTYALEEMDQSEKFLYYGNELRMGVFLRDSQRALQALEKTMDFYAAMKAITVYEVGVILYYISLVTFSSLSKETSRKKRLENIPLLKKLIARLKWYAKIAPENFINKLLLIQAEWARVLGKKQLAERLYDEAITSSQKYGFLQEEAISAELAARYHFEVGHHKRAMLYLKEALSLYEEWGASAVVNRLKIEFEELLVKKKNVQQKEQNVGSVKIGTGYLDINSIQKSTETIASTIVMEQLLKKLMGIVMEQAGAEKGLLLIPREGEYYVAAESNKGSGETKLPHEMKVSDEILPQTILQQVVRNQQLLNIGAAYEHNHFNKDPYILKKHIKSILFLPLINNQRVSAILYLENNFAKNVFTEERYGLLLFLSSQLAMAIDNSRLYGVTSQLNENLKELNVAYERFVPKDFLSLIGKSSVTKLLPGDYQAREMSVLFMDIRDFTALSEAMSAEENFTFINEFIGYMEPVIRSNKGFIDKYIGDAIMALFPGNAEDALLCAIQMAGALEKYNQIRKKKGLPPIQMGVGINSGRLILGTVGNNNRMEGTVISDTVNVASRIEHLTKEFKQQILLSEMSFQQLEDPARFNLQMIGEIAIRGKKNKIKLYAVQGHTLSL